jgi:hypothetical protein
MTIATLENLISAIALKRRDAIADMTDPIIRLDLAQTNQALDDLGDLLNLTRAGLRFRLCAIVDDDFPECCHDFDRLLVKVRGPE